MREAREIYQTHLDVVSRAIWDGDMAEVVRRTVFPQSVRFRDGTRTFATPEEYRAGVATFRARMQGLGATGYHRVCQTATFAAGDPGRIEGRHETYILRGGNYVTPPYGCDMTLVRAGNTWRVADIAVPALKHGLPTEGEAGAPDGSRAAGPPSPEP